MKKYDTKDIVLIILASSVAFFLCGSIIGTILSGQATNSVNTILREKLVDLIGMISGAIIGVIASKSDKNNNSEK